jgi:hypothetical protein
MSNLKESIITVLTESKTDVLKRLEAITNELNQLIMKGELERDEINQVQGQFTSSLEGTRRKFNAAKISPEKRAAAIAKGKETRAAGKAADAKYKNKKAAEDKEAEEKFKDGILPNYFSAYEGKEPADLMKYYIFARDIPDDGRGGGNYPNIFIYRLNKQYIDKKVGTAVLSKLGIDSPFKWQNNNRIGDMI